MIRRLVSATAVAVLAILTVTAPGVLAPVPAAADPRVDARSRDWRHDHDRRHDRHDRHDRRFLFVPRSYYVPYTYVAPVPTWVPGYWTWRWVPQAQTSYAYVPGYYDQYGSWVTSRYEPRVVEAGFYQQVWVEGYWR
jgi:hypothetical protein